MIPIHSSEDAKFIDNYIINNVKASTGLLMMENAARTIADTIKDELQIGSTVLILCGSGNNGGDGFALARHLINDFIVHLYFIGDVAKMSDETRLNYELAKIALDDYIIYTQNEDEVKELSFDFDCIVDALIGVGGNHNLRGLVVQILEKANYSNALKIAVDIPTGLNGNTPEFHLETFAADITVTMLAPKQSFLNKEIASLVGDVVIADLAVPIDVWFDENNKFLIEDDDLLELLGVRQTNSSKFDYGKIAIIAGSNQYPGAAALSANAAINMGAGLVHLFTTYLHHSTAPEVIPHILVANEDGSISSTNYDYLSEILESFDVIAIGPGLGNSSDTLSLVRKIVDNVKSNQKLVIDADGLRIFDSKSRIGRNVVITPHLGEFARIINKDYKSIKFEAEQLLIDFSKETECTALLKGSTTIIADFDKVYYSNKGNPGLASGGTGDVLTGIIAALAANADSLPLAAACGAYLHGYAADLYAEKFSQESLTASTLIDFIGLAINEIKNKV